MERKDKWKKVVLSGPQKIMSFINKYYKENEIPARLSLQLNRGNTISSGLFGPKFQIEMHITAYDTIIDGKRWGKSELYYGQEIDGLLTKVANGLGYEIANIQGTDKLYYRGRDVVISFKVRPLEKTVEQTPDISLTK